jgi:pilus assembly protein CpaC
VKSRIYKFASKPASLSSLRTAVCSAVAFSLAMSLTLLAQDARVSSVRASIIDAASAPTTMASVTRAASDAQTLHVMVGHSIFIDTKSRLRRVYVADPAVLNSVTLTPNEIIVTAMVPGISSLTLLDETGHAQSYVVSSDIDMEGLRAAMGQAMHGDVVKIEGSAGRVTLSGIVSSDAIADSAVKLASLYSKEVANALTVVPSHPKQVRLEVRILEVDRTKLLQFGVNLFNPGGNTSFLAATTTQQYPSTATLGGLSTSGAIAALTTSNPLNFMLYSAKLNLGTTIQDLQSKQILQILAEPTITTISGQKASFLSGGEFPFPVVQPSSGGGAPSVSITFRAFGVKVEFTPIVNADGTIRLKVAPEVSALDYANSVSISGFTVPALSTRRAETEVELRSNQSFAISGLLDQRTTDILNKTPGIASIPILGELFKSKNTNHSTTELIVVVTPTVVDPLSDTTAPAEPEMPIPTLNTGSFDQSLGKNRNPQPAAPPINPDKPPFGRVDPAPAPNAAPITAPVVAATETRAPTATQQDAAHNMIQVPTQPGNGTATISKPATVTVPLPATSIAPTHFPTATPSAILPIAAVPVKAADSASLISKNSKPPSSMVEVMALSHESDAEAMVAALKRRGYNVAVSHDTEDSLLHLDVGPFANTKDAEMMRQRLLLDGYDATIK